ncbi:MAG: nonstructural protein [Microvirus sp.]|nr:MAG: nonstructural protein [Microvirus sp.]
MLLKAYCVHDAKALQYHAPFFTSTDGSALRSFADLANDTATTVGRHPNDYSLWCCGTYDDNTGHINPNLPLLHIADASSLLKPQNDFFKPSPQISSPQNLSTKKSKK